MDEIRNGLSRFLSNLELAGVDRMIDDCIEEIRVSLLKTADLVGDLKNQINAILYDEIA